MARLRRVRCSFLRGGGQPDSVAGIGVATLASEHPEKFEEIWHHMPEYIEKGSKFVDMAAAFLERVGEHQGGLRNIPIAGGTRY